MFTHPISPYYLIHRLPGPQFWAGNKISRNSEIEFDKMTHHIGSLTSKNAPFIFWVLSISKEKESFTFYRDFFLSLVFYITWKKLPSTEKIRKKQLRVSNMFTEF